MATIKSIFAWFKTKLGQKWKVVVMAVILLGTILGSLFGISTFTPNTPITAGNHFVAQVCTVDGVADVGTHSSFAAQQAGPDGTRDTLTTGNGVGASSSFGSATGTTSSSPMGSGTLYGSVFTSNCTNGATLQNITFYAKKTTGGTTSAKGVVVFHSNLTILAITSAVSVTTTATERTAVFASPPTIYASTDYVLMIIAQLPVTFYLASGTTNQGHYDTSNDYSTPTDPTDASHSDNAYHIYGSYINPPTTKALNIEEQWLSVDYTADNRQLCIDTSTFNTSNAIALYYWNNASWVSLSSSLSAAGWNNFTITDYSTWANFTIRFYAEGLSAASTWQIDCALIYSWNNPVGTVSPVINDFYLNNSQTAHSTLFAFNCTDGTELKNATFSTNATGSWVNQSTTLTGTTAWANFTVASVSACTVFNFTCWVYNYNNSLAPAFLGYRTTSIWNTTMPYVNLGTALATVDAASLGYGGDNTDPYTGLIMSRNTTAQYETMLDNFKTAGQWSKLLQYAVYIEKMNLSWAGKSSDLLFAVNNFTMVGSLPYLLDDLEANNAFSPEYRWALYGYYYAVQYGGNLIKWNITAAFNQFDAACNYSTTHNTVQGLPLWIYADGTGKSYSNRYYDEDMCSVDAFLIFYSLLNVTEAYNRALHWWNYVQTYHWNPTFPNTPDPTLEYYRYSPLYNDTYTFECEAPNFLKIANILRYYNPSLVNYDRVLTDYGTRYLTNMWSSYGWLSDINNLTTYSVSHMYMGNSITRLPSTLSVWQSFLGAYPLMNDTYQSNIREMLTGHTDTAIKPAWAAMMGFANLFTAPYFRITGSASIDQNATLMGEEWMFLTGIVPESTSIAYPLEELDYEYTNDFDARMMQMNVTTRTIKIPVGDAGTITFQYGSSPITMQFNSSGVYTITFSNSWNNILTVSLTSSLPTNILYFSMPTSDSILTIGWNTVAAQTIDLSHTLGQVATSLNADSINWSAFVLQYANLSDWPFVNGYTVNTEITITGVDNTFYIYCNTAGTWTHKYT